MCSYGQEPTRAQSGRWERNAHEVFGADVENFFILIGRNPLKCPDSEK
jgi:hypothetical protein